MIIDTDLLNRLSKLGGITLEEGKLEETKKAFK